MVRREEEEGDVFGEKGALREAAEKYLAVGCGTRLKNPRVAEKVNATERHELTSLCSNSPLRIQGEERLRHDVGRSLVHPRRGGGMDRRPLLVPSPHLCSP